VKVLSNGRPSVKEVRGDAEDGGIVRLLIAGGTFYRGAVGKGIAGNYRCRSLASKRSLEAENHAGDGITQDLNCRVKKKGSWGQLKDKLKLGGKQRQAYSYLKGAEGRQVGEKEEGLRLGNNR